ncbi:hypothetical protein CTAYLR_009085 [Chrysophaeum taylorii]|uniref:Sec20 C-terminal domain-containing protein n=1 Tax=Chrysophaeum taylorii TaxID=2483200 RepID=A0AAD7XSE0_9STRA|nr:hypothetical protein CTAYLR_009085 [Chrysophaeum taylorii]
MEEGLEALRSAVAELEREGRSSREAWRKAARANAVRRRAAAAVRALERDARTESAKVRARRGAVRLQALGAALGRAARKCGAVGVARVEERERLLESSDAAETTASFARTREMLSAGLEQIGQAHDAVDRDEQALRGVETYHKRIDDAMRAARRLIRKLRHKEHRERLSMRASLAFFYLVVAYIVYRRLPFKSLRNRCSTGPKKPDGGAVPGWGMMASMPRA